MKSEIYTLRHTTHCLVKKKKTIIWILNCDYGYYHALDMLVGIAYNILLISIENTSRILLTYYYNKQIKILLL